MLTFGVVCLASYTDHSPTRFGLFKGAVQVTMTMQYFESRRVTMHLNITVSLNEPQKHKIRHLFISQIHIQWRILKCHFTAVLSISPC